MLMCGHSAGSSLFLPVHSSICIRMFGCLMTLHASDHTLVVKGPKNKILLVIIVISDGDIYTLDNGMVPLDKTLR